MQYEMSRIMALIARAFLKTTYLILLVAVSIGFVACSPDNKEDAVQLALAIKEFRQKNNQIPYENHKVASLYNDVIELVENYYLFEVDREQILSDVIEAIERLDSNAKSNSDPQLVEVGLKVALEKMDRYSTYYDQLAFRSLRESVDGEFGGLGIEVSLNEFGLEVLTILPNTPAAKSKIKEGDLIIAAGERRLANYSLREATTMLRGPLNSTIELLVIPKNVRNTYQEVQMDSFAKTVIIERDLIQIRSVRSKTLKLDDDQLQETHSNDYNNHYVLVDISHFNDHSGEELLRAMTLQTEERGPPLAWVVDVRDNPGGVFSQALVISDAFLTEGNIVSTSSKEETLRHLANEIDYSMGRPVIVLINEASASAAEIFAGAMQDLDRGILIGEKSFGKGLVQTLFPLDNGGGIKLTTSEYRTAKGHPVGEGIDPDILASDDPSTEGDEVLEVAEAYLRKHLALNALIGKDIASHENLF